MVKIIMASFLLVAGLAQAKEFPNVLLIAVDDLNDWTGFLGSEQAQTPHLNRLADRSVVFKQAHCAAPACNPSRTALLTGIAPTASGLYFNGLQENFRKSARLKNEDSLPNWFRKQGYTALGSGKIFHKYQDRQSWDDYFPPLDSSKEKNKPFDPVPPKAEREGMKVGNIELGPMDIPREKMSDWQVAEWVSSQLEKEWDKPFFLGFGIFKPHLPLYAPKAYFDRFPLDTIQLPAVLENDLDDVPLAGVQFALQHGLDRVLADAGEDGWKRVVQAYLACSSFADDCVGHVLDALERSPYRDNTIIVLFSDHGWHLGEKRHLQKFTLWERGTKSVFMIHAPQLSNGGAVFEDPVSLLDIFPTLCELAGVEAKPGLDGESLVPFMKNPSLVKKTPAVITWEPGNHAVRSRDWRYIRYADGSEELYNHSIDGNEWHNVAGNPELSDVLVELRNWLPKEEVAPDPVCDPQQLERSLQKRAVERVSGEWVLKKK